MPDTETLTDAEKAEVVRDHEAQTTGTENHYQHPILRGFVYTDGIKFMADTCGAHWLIDVVASHQTSRKVGSELFQVWRIAAHQKGEGVRVEAWNDTPGHEDSRRLCRQDIEYSDFPRELMPFEFYVENRCCLLKGER